MSTTQVLTPEEVGLSTLESLTKTHRLNQWIFDSIRPWVKGRILEIGSGIGNISSLFVEHGMPLSLSDYNASYCRTLTEKFISEPKVEAVYHLDLAARDFPGRYPTLAGQFDTVFALNVVEHIGYDHLALENCHHLLRKDGQVIILVPAYQGLYNILDKNLEHFRRYTRRTLTEKIALAGFQVQKSWHFNLAGIAGWYWSGRVMKKQTLPAGSLGIYNSLVPVFKVLDKVTFNSVGLSVIAVGRK